MISKMDAKKKGNKEPAGIWEMFKLCDKAYKTARENAGVAIVNFKGVESLVVEKLSRYVQNKKSGSYIIYELKGDNFYEAHIKYKNDKNRQRRIW